jgi:hypothetical protein
MNEWIQKVMKYLPILREHTFKISENTLLTTKGMMKFWRS